MNANTNAVAPFASTTSSTNPQASLEEFIGGIVRNSFLVTTDCRWNNREEGSYERIQAVRNSLDSMFLNAKGVQDLVKATVIYGVYQFASINAYPRNEMTWADCLAEGVSEYIGVLLGLRKVDPYFLRHEIPWTEKIEALMTQKWVESRSAWHMSYRESYTTWVAPTICKGLGLWVHFYVAGDWDNRRPVMCFSITPRNRAQIRAERAKTQEKYLVLRDKVASAIIRGKTVKYTPGQKGGFFSLEGEEGAVAAERLLQHIGIPLSVLDVYIETYSVSFLLPEFSGTKVAGVRPGSIDWEIENS